MDHVAEESAEFMLRWVSHQPRLKREAIQEILDSMDLFEQLRFLRSMLRSGLRLVDGTQVQEFFSLYQRCS